MLRSAAPFQRRAVSPELTEHHLRVRVAANVRRLREAGKLTVEEAAHRAGIHWRHWQKVEAGETSATLRTVARISNALEVEPGELLAAVTTKAESANPVAP